MWLHLLFLAVSIVYIPPVSAVEDTSAGNEGAVYNAAVGLTTLTVFETVTTRVAYIPSAASGPNAAVSLP
jgi:hypothetical protein